MTPLKTLQLEEHTNLSVKIFDQRSDMGASAAQEVAVALRNMLSQKQSVSVVFAAAPSQNEFLAALLLEPDIDWSRVHAFHMDEYLGLPVDAPQGFANFLRERLFNHLPFGSVSLMDGTPPNPEMECARYAAVRATLEGPVTEQVPATILRLHRRLFYISTGTVPPCCPWKGESHESVVDPQCTSHHAVPHP